MQQTQLSILQAPQHLHLQVAWHNRNKKSVVKLPTVRQNLLCGTESWVLKVELQTTKPTVGYFNQNLPLAGKLQIRRLSVSCASLTIKISPHLLHYGLPSQGLPPQVSPLWIHSSQLEQWIDFRKSLQQNCRIFHHTKNLLRNNINRLHLSDSSNRPL